MKCIYVPILALAFIAVASPTYAINYGDQAPDFELTDIEGVTHTLSQYEGRVVFLNFFGFS